MSTKLAVRFAYVVLIIFTIPLGQVFAQGGEPAEISYGQTVEGRLEPSQPSAFYAFNASAGDVVTISMNVTDGGLNPFLILNDANQIPLATDDNSGGGFNARLTFVVPSEGRYVIQATHAGGILPEGGGAYSLNLASDNAPAVVETETPEILPTPNPTSLPVVEEDTTRIAELILDQTIQDVLTPQTAFRFYWFEGQEGAQVTVTPQTAPFQAVYVLYDANFVELQQAEPGMNLTVSLTQNGIYFLAVSLPDPDSEGGTYLFTAAITGNTALEGNFIDLSYGQSMRGDLDSTVPMITYRFRGTAGDVVTISMRRAGGDLNSYLYLMDSAGQLLFEDNDSAGNGDAQIVFTLPDTGVYLIIASRMGQTQGTTSGSYLLDLQSDAPPPAVEETAVLPADYEGLPQITYGETIEDAITADSYRDVYVFQGEAGDSVTIEMDSLDESDLDPLLILLDAARIPLADNDDIEDGVIRNSRIEFTLLNTAYYAIVATRFEQENGTSVGPYSLTLNGPEDIQTLPDIPASGSNTTGLASITLLPEIPSQGTIEDGQPMLYSVNAAADMAFDVIATADPGIDPVLILVDESLNEIASSSLGRLSGITPSGDGSYFVILVPRFGAANVTVGNYSLLLTSEGGGETVTVEPDGTQVITYGQTINGVIDNEQVSRVYTFAALGGETVRITMEATSGSSLDSYLELQDTDGNVLERNDDIDPGVVRNSQIVAEIPGDGEYTILASRYVGDDATPTSGTYRLMLERVDAALGGVSTTSERISYGQTLTGEISNEAYLLFYVFDGTAGDTITITIDSLSGNLDAVLYVYGSSEAGWVEIANNDDSPTGATYDPLLSGMILPQSGKYLIAVGRYNLDRGDTTGSFSITLERN